MSVIMGYEAVHKNMTKQFEKILGGIQEQRQVMLVPFVCGAGASLPGTERGPAEVKRLGLHTQLSNSWRSVAWAEPAAARE
jgi:hypothetical protein